MSVMEVTELTLSCDALNARIALLCEEMQRATGVLKDQGIFPSDKLDKQLKETRVAFHQFESAVRVAAAQMNIPFPEEMKSLRDLELLMKSVHETQQRNEIWEKIRQRLILPLDRVMKVIHRDNPEFLPLRAVQGKAVALRARIVEAKSTMSQDSKSTEALQAEVEPFVQFLTLVESPDQLDDREWDRLQESVATEFGRPLAIACARGRMVIPLLRVTPLRSESAQAQDPELRPYMHMSS